MCHHLLHQTPSRQRSFPSAQEHFYVFIRLKITPISAAAHRLPPIRKPINSPVPGDITHHKSGLSQAWIHSHFYRKPDSFEGRRSISPCDSRIIFLRTKHPHDFIFCNYVSERQLPGPWRADTWCDQAQLRGSAHPNIMGWLQTCLLSLGEKTLCLGFLALLVRSKSPSWTEFRASSAYCFQRSAETTIR